jgi:hypothetical protein
MSFDIHPKITKQYILARLTQEDIFNFYLSNFNVVVQTKSLFSSPFRRDKDPSCGFKYRGDGKLIMKDFGGDFHGDCFDVVKYIFRYNNFYDILDTIARDFCIHKYENNKPKDFNINTQKLIVESINKVTEKTDIKIKVRKWLKVDEAYWKKFNITIELLNYYNVYPIQFFWVNGDLKYEFEADDLAYAYYFGKNSDNNEKFKIYLPLRKKFRFRQNCSVLQGLNQLKKAEYGVITKSLKDVISLRSFGIQAVAPNSENTKLQLDDILTIRKSIFKPYSFYDNDLTGIRNAKEIRDTYTIPIIMYHKRTVAEEFYHPKIKDFCNIVEYLGKEKTKNLIKQIQTNIENEKLNSPF